MDNGLEVMLLWTIALLCQTSPQILYLCWSVDLDTTQKFSATNNTVFQDGATATLESLYVISKTQTCQPVCILCSTLWILQNTSAIRQIVYTNSLWKTKRRGRVWPTYVWIRIRRGRRWIFISNALVLERRTISVVTTATHADRLLLFLDTKKWPDHLQITEFCIFYWHTYFYWESV